MKSHALIAALATILSMLANPVAGKDKPASGLDPFSSRILFLTSQAYSGDLVSEAEALLGMAFADGLEAADAICQYHASLGGLQGSFVAILSTSTVDAASRLSTVLSPYRSVSGLPIAANFTALFGTTDGIELAGADLPAAWLNTAPDVDELGSRTFGGNPANNAWTGTRPTGQMDRAGPGPSGTPLPAYSFCNDWIDDAEPVDETCHAVNPAQQPCGLTGETQARTPAWIAGEYAGCHSLRRLYCVQQ
jgi:hypothetical protein